MIVFFFWIDCDHLDAPDHLNAPVHKFKVTNFIIKLKFEFKVFFSFGYISRILVLNIIKIWFSNLHIILWNKYHLLFPLKSTHIFTEICCVKCVSVPFRPASFRSPKYQQLNLSAQRNC